jgi:hypothetical protein
MVLYPDIPSTYAVVAILVELSFAACVVAVVPFGSAGVPVTFAAAIVPSAVTVMLVPSGLTLPVRDVVAIGVPQLPKPKPHAPEDVKIAIKKISSIFFMSISP